MHGTVLKRLTLGLARVTPVPSEFHLKHESMTDRACGSLTRFAEEMARRKAVFNPACDWGSKGGLVCLSPEGDSTLGLSWPSEDAVSEPPFRRGVAPHCDFMNLHILVGYREITLFPEGTAGTHGEWA